MQRLTLFTLLLALPNMLLRPPRVEACGYIPWSEDSESAESALRELTSGVYFGEPRGIFEEGNERVGINTQRYTESEIERAARSAFELAMRRNKKVCSMEKANVMESGILWREVVTEVGKDYPEVELSHSTLHLYLRPGSDFAKREEVLALWYRGLVRAAARELLPRWEAKIGVSTEKLFVRHMKTKWGSCNPSQRTLRLNTELAKKRSTCLEYILVHELIHLHEPTHNARFQELMDRHLPKWREIREELNRQPLSHERWTY